MDYRILILVGFVMVLVGFLVPFLMVIKMMEASYFWGFLSYALSVAGLFLGVIGGSLYVRVKRSSEDEQNEYHQHYK